MTHTAMAHTTGPLDPVSQRILTRLDRLSQRVRLNGLGHRRLTAPDTRLLSTALLRDIDETILPRHVRVKTNAGQSFTLDIAGRRLLRLVAAGSGGSVGEPDDPFEAAQILAGDLKRSLLRATEVTLQSARMDSEAARTSVGSSATALASALGLDLDALEGERKIDKAIRAVSRYAIVALVCDGRGQIIQRVGSAEDAAPLEALADQHLREMITTMIQTLGRDAKSGCMTLGTNTQTGHQMVIAVCDKHQIIACADHRQMMALLPVLQDIFAT